MDSTTWDGRYAAGRQWSLTPNVFVEQICAPLPPGRAVDLASGEGRNAVWLAARGWDVTAVDFSQVAATRADERAAAESVTISTVVADVLSWDPGPEPFDLALLCYLQVPRAERDLVLGVAAAAVAPGGLVVVVAHDLANLGGGTGGPQSPDVLWTADDAAASLGGRGLAVDVAEVRDREVAGADRPALDTVVVARRGR